MRYCIRIFQKIGGLRMNEDISSLFIDKGKNLIAILNATKGMKFTPFEAHQMTNIPMSTIYRMLKLGVKHGLIKVVGSNIGTSSKEFVYRGKIMNISFSYTEIKNSDY